jgi:hypothetical protein
MSLKELSKIPEKLFFMIICGKTGKNSTHYIEIEACKPLTLILKDIMVDQGGSYVEIPDNYNNFLYNPKVSHSCFWHCMKKANVTFTKSIPEIMDCLKMDYRSMVNTTKICKILEFCKHKVRINLYQFKEDGIGVKRSKYPKTGEADHIINLLLVKNHFMLIENMKQFSKTRLSDYTVVDPSKLDVPNYQLPSQFKSILFKKIKEDYPQVSKHTYMWDMEAHLNENNDHVPYNLGFARLDQINDKNQIIVHYGYDCMVKFVEDLSKLYQILKLAHEDEISRSITLQMS